MTTGQGIDQFEAFRGRFPSSVHDWREVWALDDALLIPCSPGTPRTNSRGMARPVSPGRQLCPVREWPYYSYLVVYSDRETALADLARWHDGVAFVRSLSHSGPPRVRAAARALLDGDRAAVTELVGTLLKSRTTRR